MDKQTANELCRAAGVSEVPTGMDPQEWLDDNDVFETTSLNSAQVEVVREVFSERATQAEDDNIRLSSVIARIQEAGYVHTTAIGYANMIWEPLDSGIWGAMSAAPNTISAGYFGFVGGDPVAYRYSYGNATVYYVKPSLLDNCLHNWWIGKIAVGFGCERMDVIGSIRGAANHALELADKYAQCLGGDDAVRFIAKVGRENLERLAAL